MAEKRFGNVTGVLVGAVEGMYFLVKQGLEEKGFPGSVLVVAAAEKGLGVAARGSMLEMSVVTAKKGLSGLVVATAEKGLGKVVGGLAVGELREEAALDWDV